MVQNRELLEKGWFLVKDFIGDLARNVKTEILVAAFSLLFWLVDSGGIIKKVDFPTYFSQDRLNGIAAFFAITIGVYITIITVLATSEIGISKEMLKRRLDRPLINVIMVGLAENFISVGFSVFVPMDANTSFMLVVSLIISVISFIKFIILLVIIFKKNMEQMAKVIEEEEMYKSEMLTYVKGISRYIRENIKENEL